MFRYLLLCLVFVAAASLLCYSLRRHIQWRTDAKVLAVILVLTVIFDSLLIAIGIFAFRPEHILGVFIGKAPVEDLTYAVCAVLLAVPLWRKLRRADEK